MRSNLIRRFDDLLIMIDGDGEARLEALSCSDFEETVRECAKIAKEEMAAESPWGPVLSAIILNIGSPIDDDLLRKYEDLVAEFFGQGGPSDV